MNNDEWMKGQKEEKGLGLRNHEPKKNKQINTYKNNIHHELGFNTFSCIAVGSSALQVGDLLWTIFYISTMKFPSDCNPDCLLAMSFSWYAVWICVSSLNITVIKFFAVHDFFSLAGCKLVFIGLHGDDGLHSAVLYLKSQADFLQLAHKRWICFSFLLLCIFLFLWLPKCFLFTIISFCLFSLQILDKSGTTDWQPIPFATTNKNW